MSKQIEIEGQNTGQVGRRGVIVLPAATRRRYGLNDGSLFISEEREDGILIRPARASPVALRDVREKIQTGLNELKEGKGIPGEEVYEAMKKVSAATRKRNKK